MDHAMSQQHKVCYNVATCAKIKPAFLCVKASKKLMLIDWHTALVEPKGYRD